MSVKAGSDFLAEVESWAHCMRTRRRGGQSNLMLVVRNGLGYADGGSSGTRWSERLAQMDAALCRLEAFDRTIIRTEFLKPPFGESSTDGMKRARKTKARTIVDPMGNRGMFMRAYEIRLDSALARWERALEDLVANQK